MKQRFILIIRLLIITLLFAGPSAAESEPGTVHRLENRFATQFTVDQYSNGNKLISIADGQRFLVVDENNEIPSDIEPGVVPLKQPIGNIYLAATAAMCLFDAMDRLDAVTLSGTKADGWYIENARAAMEEGKILFAGKYNEPNYEMLLENSCALAIESQMIGHASDVKAKLEELGIPVLVDLSSSEKHPLGRTEWIRLYGALLDEEEKADAIFQKQVEFLTSVQNRERLGKTAAFFYISSSGLVVVRKTGDYVSKMIELAGADYVFNDIGDPEKSTSTVTIEMETFFSKAKGADYIIYNSTIAGEIRTIDELLAKSELLSAFKAVQNGNVWCTGQNMYQETTSLGEMIRSFHMIFSGEADGMDELPFLYRLK